MSSAYLSIDAALGRYERLLEHARAGRVTARAWLAIARRLECCADMALGERRRKIADRAEDARARAGRAA